MHIYMHMNTHTHNHTNMNIYMIHIHKYKHVIIQYLQKKFEPKSIKFKKINFSSLSISTKCDKNTPLI
jgi:hypothetical protein